LIENFTLPCKVSPLRLSKKLYAEIDQATKDGTDELFSQSDKLMNKMIAWLQNEGDQRSLNERGRTWHCSDSIISQRRDPVQKVKA
jgi:hypothetical protein